MDGSVDWRGDDDGSDRIAAAREHHGTLLSMLLSKIAIEATGGREKPCRLLVVW